MFDSATSTLEYRPSFGRRAPAEPASDAAQGREQRRSVDAITAGLRARILATRPLARTPAELRLPR